MANITIPVGQFPFSFGAAANLALASQPWYTTANINKISGVNGTRKGYITGVPGNGFGTTQLIAVASGQALNGYVLDVKTAFQVDATVLGLSTTSGSDSGTMTVAAGESPKYFDVLVTSRAQYGEPVFTTGAGSVAYQINGIAAANVAALNSFINGLSDAALVAGSNTITFIVTSTNNAAAVVETPIS
jgi:hypothetical protein